MTGLPELIRSLLHRGSSEPPGTGSIDPITNLPTRQALIARLQKTLAKSKHKASVAVAIVEFNIGGANIDDHRALLRRLGGLLRAWVPVEYEVGRLREREFAIVFSGVQQVEIQNLASNIVERIRRETTLEGQQRQIVTIIGLGYSSRGEGDASHLLTLADIALHYASETGRGWHAVVDSAFSPGRGTRAA